MQVGDRLPTAVAPLRQLAVSGAGPQALSVALLLADQLLTCVVKIEASTKPLSECSLCRLPAEVLPWLEVEQNLECLALKGEGNLDHCDQELSWAASCVWMKCQVTGCHCSTAA